MQARPPCRQKDPTEATALIDDEFSPARNTIGSRQKENPTEIKKPHTIPVQFFNVFRPPSRHKTPPKAVGLDLPDRPHTPPETQKELEDLKELSKTQHFRGLANFSEENPPGDSPNNSGNKNDTI